MRHHSPPRGPCLAVPRGGGAALLPRPWEVRLLRQTFGTALVSLRSRGPRWRGTPAFRAGARVRFPSGALRDGDLRRVVLPPGGRRDGAFLQLAQHRADPPLRRFPGHYVLRPSSRGVPSPGFCGFNSRGGCILPRTHPDKAARRCSRHRVPPRRFSGRYIPLPGRPPPGRTAFLRCRLRSRPGVSAKLSQDRAPGFEPGCRTFESCHGRWLRQAQHGAIAPVRACDLTAQPNRSRN